MIEFDLNSKIFAFDLLSKEISMYLKGNPNPILDEALQKSTLENAWFTDKMLRYSLNAIARITTKKHLEKWMSSYPDNSKKSSAKRIVVIMAGNIPLVGFHDFLCVLISGNVFIGKLSSKDKYLLPALAGILNSIDPRFKRTILFTHDKLPEFDSVIATGSNNTSRYFEYYFTRYPHIFRKNRKSIAILTGNETSKQLEKLADDIFLYFGLGCRNVSKIFIPENYDTKLLISAFGKYASIIDNTKFYNNYDYNKVVMMVNKIPYIDAGFFLLTKNSSALSPVSVIHYETYKNIEIVKNWVSENSELLQCVVAGNKIISSAIDFGKSQEPSLTDYADGIDVINFLNQLI